jgi:hypothetical protein
VNIDNWNGDDSLNGSKSEAAGSHGYFAQLTRSLNGGTDGSWVSAISPYGTALLTGGFTVH